MRAGNFLRFTWLGVTAMLAAVASAEVHLDTSSSSGALQVDVIGTSQGPWTPTGSVTPMVLNPDGDILGDTSPGWTNHDPARVLAAWIRPERATLEQASGVVSGWTTVPEIQAPGATGQAVVDGLDGGWSIVWQQGTTGGPYIQMTSTDLGERTVDAITVVDGTLMSVSTSGNVVHVISYHAASRAVTDTRVDVMFVPTQPIPIQMSVGPTVVLGHLDQPPGKSPSSRGFCVSCGGIQVVNVSGPDGPMGELVQWWSGPHVLEYVGISDVGELGRPGRINAPNLPVGSDQLSLLAMREAFKR